MRNLVTLPHLPNVIITDSKLEEPLISQEDSDCPRTMILAPSMKSLKRHESFAGSKPLGKIFRFFDKMNSRAGSQEAQKSIETCSCTDPYKFMECEIHKRR